MRMRDICMDRQGGAELVYACAAVRGGAENVTFDLKAGDL